MCVTNHHYFESIAPEGRVDIANFLHHCVIPGNRVYIDSQALESAWWELPAVIPGQYVT
jgi:hypothetical protein